MPGDYIVWKLLIAIGWYYKMINGKLNLSFVQRFIIWVAILNNVILIANEFGCFKKELSGRVIMHCV